MNNLENRITRLESNLKGKDTVSGPDIDINDVVRKLGFDPNIVRATAKEKNQSIAEVIAGELGMSYRDFREALRLRAQGK